MIFVLVLCHVTLKLAVSRPSVPFIVVVDSVIVDTDYNDANSAE